MKAGATAGTVRSMTSTLGASTCRTPDSSSWSIITGPPACRAISSRGSPACGARAADAPGSDRPPLHGFVLKMQIVIVFAHHLEAQAMIKPGGSEIQFERRQSNSLIGVPRIHADLRKD